MLRRGLAILGQKLGHFRILGPLGRGGMGVVHRAEDVDLGREVALKTLPAAALANPVERARLRAEARAAAAVSHANVATIYEVGTDGDVDYIAMELVRGETLRDALVRGLG